MITSRFSRPFLFFLIATVVLLAAFAGWSALVFSDSGVADFDRQVSQACRDFAQDHVAVRDFLAFATTTGGTRANLILALGGALWMWRHHRPRFAIAWLLIALVGGLIISELKGQFGRPRPPMEWRDEIAREENESYPSGHTMGSVVGYGMLGFVLVQRAKTWPARLAIALLLTTWVATIGFSRIFLRAHWVSDVVGGWLMGMAYVSACLTLYFHRPRTSLASPSPAPSSPPSSPPSSQP